MQKWRRDRSRRRKPGQGGDEQQHPSHPAPLIPAYPEDIEAQAQREFAQRQAGREAEAQREARTQREAQRETPQPRPEPVVEQQPERDPQPAKRSRRRKRKGGGGQATPAPEPPAFDPGFATGEAAEVEIPDTAVELPEEPRSAEEAAEAPTLSAPPPPPLPKKTKGAVVLAVGLPGSGKSTWFKRRGVTPLSSDLLRHLLFDNVQEQRHQDLVFSTLRSLLRARLIARMPWNYVDATNLSPKDRKHWVRMAHDFGFEAHAVYFDVPLEVCMERNAKRHRVVPEEIMQRMSQKLRQPTFDEGFAKITVVRVKQKGEAEPGSEEASDD